MKQDTQDNLEKFVKENSSEFDTLTPSNAVWEGIQSKLEAPNRLNLKLVLWRAAAILLFVFSIGLTFYVNKDSILKTNKMVAYDDEFLTTEKYYSSIITEKEQLVAMVANTYPEVKNDFESDWNLLGKNYSELKAEYEVNQSSEVLNALVQNLQSRVRLLNRQIEILKSIDSDNTHDKNRGIKI